jgi:hypothetical protein
MAKKKPTPGDYKVGRGKPPIHTRFKPGQSGNPNGRPKGSRNLALLFLEALLEEAEINENGQKKSMPMVQVLIKKQLQLGLRGDPRAIESLLNRFERLVPDNDRGEQDDLSQEDEIILARHLGRVPKPQGKPDNDDCPEVAKPHRRRKRKGKGNE